jgi:hypothetical protein
MMRDGVVKNFAGVDFARDFQICGDQMVIRKSSKDLSLNNLVSLDIKHPGEVAPLVSSIVTAYIAVNDALYYCTKTGTGINNYALYKWQNGGNSVVCQLSVPITDLKSDGVNFYGIGKGILYRITGNGMSEIISGVNAFDVTEDGVFFATEKGIFRKDEGKRPVFLYPVMCVSSIHIYNNDLYTYLGQNLTVLRTDGRYKVDEML